MKYFRFFYAGKLILVFGFIVLSSCNSIGDSRLTSDANPEPTVTAENVSGEVLAPRRQCYQLIPGFQSESTICKSLEQNLNEFCGDRPMVCSLEISPKHPEFSLPQWMSLDVKKNMTLIEKLERGANMVETRGNASAGDRVWNEFKQQLFKYQANGTVSLKRAEIDLLNRGKPETVYMVDNGYCDALNFGEARNDPGWQKVFAGRPASEQFAKVGPSIYFAKHAEIMDNPTWRSRAEGGGSAFLGAKRLSEFRRSNIFLYEGRVFLFGWGSGVATVHRLVSVTIPPESSAYSYYKDTPGEQEDSATECGFSYVGSESSTTDTGK